MNTRAETARQESFRWEQTVQPPPLFWTPGEEMFTIQQLVDLGYAPDSTIRKWIRTRRLRAITGNGRDVRIPASEVARVFQPIDPAKNEGRQFNWNSAEAEPPTRKRNGTPKGRE